MTPIEFTKYPDISKVVAIPHVISESEVALIICKSRPAADTHEIALYSENSAKKIRTLCKTILDESIDEMTDIHIFSWDGPIPKIRQLLKVITVYDGRLGIVLENIL